MLGPVMEATPPKIGWLVCGAEMTTLSTTIANRLRVSVVP
jgi:hypothetical protein